MEDAGGRRPFLRQRTRMPESTNAAPPQPAAPEPGLTPQEIVTRAQALIPAVRGQQDEAEQLGHHTGALNREFVRAGFYRILQPRRFGGYEFGLPTFWQVMLAVSAGDHLRPRRFLGGQARQPAAAPLPGRGHVPGPHRRAAPGHRGRAGPVHFGLPDSLF